MAETTPNLSDRALSDLIKECLRGEPTAQRGLWYDRDAEEWIVGRYRDDKILGNDPSLTEALQAAANELDEDPMRKRRLLYDMGLLDREIAARQGVSKHTIASWRDTRGLPPNGPLSDEDWRRREQRVHELYQDGLSPSEIAATIGISTSTLRDWCNKFNIRFETGDPQTSKRQQLYEQGLSDAEIAEEQDVAKSTIASWRSRNDLPPNHSPSEDQNDNRLTKRRNLYEEGLSDAEIAEEQDVSRDTIVSWRSRNDLPPNQPTTPSYTEKRQQLYDRGLSDEQMADELYVLKDTIKKWRKENNLPNNKDSSMTERQKRLAMRRQLFDQGYTDEQIADEQDIALSTVQEWRRERGLYPNTPND